VRRGAEAVLQTRRGITLVGVLENGHSLATEVCRLRPDVVLIDLALASGDALEAIQTIHQECPDVDVLVVTRELDPERALQAIEAGAVGYVCKDISPEDLVEAVERVATGGAMLDPVIARHIVTRLAMRNGNGVNGFKAKGLTPRELEILGVLAHGMNVREIAGRFYLSEATVKTHLKAVYRKLGVKNRAQAAALAVTHGLNGATPANGAILPTGSPIRTR
jgi:DNA-binding NarL/FixJ family response regulator